MKPDDEEAARKDALARLRDPANYMASPHDWKFSREDIYDEAVLRHAVVRRLWGKE